MALLRRSGRGWSALFRRKAHLSRQINELRRLEDQLRYFRQAGEGQTKKVAGRPVGSSRGQSRKPDPVYNQFDFSERASFRAFFLAIDVY